MTNARSDGDGAEDAAGDFGGGIRFSHGIEMQRGDTGFEQLLGLAGAPIDASRSLDPRLGRFHRGDQFIGQVHMENMGQMLSCLAVVKGFKPGMIGTSIPMARQRATKSK